jgi:hypothetical protein
MTAAAPRDARAALPDTRDIPGKRAPSGQALCAPRGQRGFRFGS